MNNKKPLLKIHSCPMKNCPYCNAIGAVTGIAMVAINAVVRSCFMRLAIRTPGNA
jgi:hypothetical protein